MMHKLMLRLCTAASAQSAGDTLLPEIRRRQIWPSPNHNNWLVTAALQVPAGSSDLMPLFQPNCMVSENIAAVRRRKWDHIFPRQNIFNWISLRTLYSSRRNRFDYIVVSHEMGEIITCGVYRTFSRRVEQKGRYGTVIIIWGSDRCLVFCTERVYSRHLSKKGRILHKVVLHSLIIEIWTTEMIWKGAKCPKTR